MPIHCLICESSIVISKETATSLALFIGTLNGFMRAAQQTRAPAQKGDGDVGHPIEHTVNQIIDGVAGAAASWASTLAFNRDIQRFQFQYFDYVCLRCGAKFDALTEP
jgi:hypothetical protein